jgi:hypothetical protein
MFAWCLADMPGILRELAEHELKIFPNAKPIKQSMRRYNPEKARSMGEEINCLLAAKFIREMKEATWLSPPVMVEKTTFRFLESTRSSTPPPAASVSHSSTPTPDTTK